jgi:hypothetical protein
MSVENGVRVNHSTPQSQNAAAARRCLQSVTSRFSPEGAGQGRTRQDRVGQSGPVACLPKHNRRAVIGRQDQKAHTESFLPLG